MSLAAETVPSTKATGIDAVFFSVRDVARGIAFYRELLDVKETTFESDHGAEFVLADGNAFGVGKYTDGEWVSSGCVLFAVPDVKAAAKRVVELGGKLDGEHRTFPACEA